MVMSAEILGECPFSFLYSTKPRRTILGPFSRRGSQQRRRRLGRRHPGRRPRRIGVTRRSGAGHLSQVVGAAADSDHGSFLSFGSLGLAKVPDSLSTVM